MKIDSILNTSHFCQYFTFISIIIGSYQSLGQLKEVEILGNIENVAGDRQDSIYYELFKLNMFDDLGKAKSFAKRAFQISSKYKHPNWIAKSCRALAYVYDKENNSDSTRFYLLKGIDVGRRFELKPTLVLLYNDLGAHLELRDVYDSALRYYNLSLEAAKEIGSNKDEAIALNNIGLVFYYLYNYPEALENLKASVEIKRKYNNPTLKISLMNIALIYNDQGRYDEAIEILAEVETECKANCEDHILMDLYFDLGYAFFAKNERVKAYDYFRRTFDLATKLNNKKKLAFTHYYFSRFKLEDGEYESALFDLDESARIAEEINLKRLQRDIYDTYVKIYREQNNLAKVVEYQNKYMSIKDSIFNEKMASNLKEIQLDAQRKQSEVIIQQKDTEIERVRLITGLVGIISVLLIVVSVLIYRTYKASQRMKGILEKEITSRTAELVKSNADLTQMTQEYDQLVYRASHDIRGPLATLMGLTNIAKQDYDEPQRVKDYLGKIESTAHGLNQTLSQLMETNRIRNLPICVEDFEISELVESVFGSFKSLNHFPLISLRTEKGDWSEPLLTDKNLVAFVLTKLLDNAFRYFATHKMEKYIKVSWSQNKNETTIAVEDNGLGIDSQAKEKIFQLFYVASDIHGTGLGLFLAQMAANRLGGRIFLARSANPTIFKLVIATNLAKAQAEEKPVMTVAK